MAPSTRRAFAVFALSVLPLSLARLSAHDVPIERTVEMFVLPQADGLTVLVRLPAAVLADAALPRLPGGYLDLSAIDRPLRLVASGAAASLEFRQDDVALPQPSTTAMVAAAADASFASPAAALAHLHGPPLAPGQLVDAQRSVVDLELRFPPGAGSQNLSARLNAFLAPGQNVRTEAHVLLPSGEMRTMTVTGPPERVAFDPGAADVARQFVQRALGALLDGGDQLFFLVCLLIPVRAARQAMAPIAAMALGQLLAILAVGARLPVSPDGPVLAATVGASALMVASLQNVVAARDGAVWPLAFAFGALNGLGFGDTLSRAMPFAGTHALLGAGLFILVLAAGQGWIAALLWATRGWLDDRGLPRTPATLVASVWIAHTALHRLIDRGRLLEQSGWMALDRAVLLLAIGWALVMIAAAAGHALAPEARGVPGAGASEI